jgi:ketosteroid isomerase-like protein
VTEVDPSGLDICGLHAAWTTAFAGQDIDALLSLLTPDYELWASGVPPVHRDGLRPRLSAAFAAYDITSEFECEERLISGDFAFERGWDIQMLKPRGDGKTASHRQRVFLLLRRCSDGQWRFARGMSQPGPSA